jgi:hypothetical protein
MKHSLPLSILWRPTLAAIVLCQLCFPLTGRAQTPASATDSIAVTPRTIRLSGIVVSGATGEFFDAESLLVSVNTTPAPVDSAGQFVATVSTSSDYVTVAAHAVGYAPFRQLIALESTQSSYFVSIILDTLPLNHHALQSTSSSVKRDSTTGLPWTISGSIIDSRYDQALQHKATVVLFDGDTVKGTHDGGFRITTPWSGSHTFRLSLAGFQTVMQEIILVDKLKNPAIVLATAPLGTEIQRRQITVTASQQPVHTSAEMSRVQLGRKELQRTAATISDPVRVLQTLPGVASESDAMARPIVRGGEAQEARLFMDGIPLIQPYHFGGARSIFNQYVTDHVTLYTSGFPAEFHNAQSALIDVQYRTAAAESLTVEGEVSMMQYAAAMGIPLARYNLGISLHSQGSFYQAFPILVTKIMGAIQDDEELTNVSKTLTLPSYLDHGIGLEWNPTPQLNLSVHETITTDRYKSLQLLYEVIAYSSNEDGSARPPFIMRYERANSERDELLRGYYDSDSVKILDVVDTSMAYASHYNVVQGHARYTLDKTNIFTLSAAWQKRWWDLVFSETDIDSLGRSNFDVSINNYNGHLQWHNATNAHHGLKAGVQLDYTNASFDVWLPRYLHNLITSGSTNRNDFFGPLAGDSTLSLPWSKDYSDIDDRLLVTYKGAKRYYNFSLYAQDSWQATPQLTLDGGLRLETTGADHSISLSPRLLAKYSINQTHELMGAVGRYSQNNYDPHTIALTPNLKPENVWHGDVGLESRLLPWLTQKVNGYGKYYTDLLAEVITPRVPAALEQEFEAYLAHKRDVDFEYYTPEQEEELFERFKISTVLYQSSYTSKGRGYSFGAEYFLRFNPVDFWNGWVSLTLSRSFRQDRPGWQWHPFALERPLLISVVNYYRLPRRYELSAKYRYLSGIPYTDLTVDSALTIDKHSARRFAPYQSLDFRISKGFVGKRLNGHVNFDIINSFNSPNMFLLDKKDRTLEGRTYSLPATILYFGVDFKL